VRMLTLNVNLLNSEAFANGSSSASESEAFAGGGASIGLQSCLLRQPKPTGPSLPPVFTLQTRKLVNLGVCKISQLDASLVFVVILARVQIVLVYHFGLVTSSLSVGFKISGTCVETLCHLIQRHERRSVRSSSG
jgi:hypothetical protein